MVIVFISGWVVGLFMGFILYSLSDAGLLSFFGNEKREEESEDRTIGLHEDEARNRYCEGQQEERGGK